MQYALLIKRSPWKESYVKTGRYAGRIPDTESKKKVTQIFDRTYLENPEEKLDVLWKKKQIPIKPGDRIAITGGSRGIAGYQRIMKKTVSLVKEAGGIPFIVPAIQNQGYDICLPFYYFFASPKGTDDALVEQFNAAVKEIVENDTEYQDQIASTYYQKPTFYGKQDGLDKYQEVYDLLAEVDFSA